jgi:ubiquitin-protein ligase
MVTPREKRKIRLKNEFGEMERIRRQGGVIEWQRVDGVEPHVNSYMLTLRVRTIIGPEPTYRSEHVIVVTLPPDYPDSKPLAIMETKPPPFHPNWWPDGRWCEGTWQESESLGMFIVRMVRTLQYDKQITHEDDAANIDAAAWYRTKKQSNLFPCDTSALPDPKAEDLEFTVNQSSSAKKSFQICKPSKSFKIR